MTVLGNTSDCSNADYYPAGFAALMRLQVPANSTMTKISGWISSNASITTQAFRFEAYRGTSTTPNGARFYLSPSNIALTAQASTQYDESPGSPPSLTNSEYIWVGAVAMVTSNVGFRYDSSSGDRIADYDYGGGDTPSPDPLTGGEINEYADYRYAFWIEYTVGGSTYTLTADSRSHTLTGQTAGAYFNRLLAADTGSHSFAGQSVNALFNRALIADTNSYSLSGQANNLYLSRLLAANSSSYSLNGQNTDLLANRKLTADSQSYSLAGQSATLLSNKLMVAASASFTLAGQSNTLVYARVLIADTQSYSLAGQDATLTYSPVGGYTMAADGASFSLSANDAGLRADRVLPADSSAISLSGQAASLLSGKVMTTNTGAYSLTGNSASLLSFKVLSASTSSYILTGQPADFGYISGGFIQFPASVVRAEEDYSITLEQDNSVKMEEDYLVRV